MKTTLLALIAAAGLATLSTAAVADRSASFRDSRIEQSDRSAAKHGYGHGHERGPRNYAPAPRYAPNRVVVRPAPRYYAPRYAPPRGYVSRSWQRGHYLPAQYRARPYVVDYRAYRLAPPPRGYHYVRVDDRAVLVAISSGLIANVVSDLFYR